MALTAILFVLFLLPILVYGYLKWHYSYWTRRGVVQLQPQFFYGDLR